MVKILLRKWDEVRDEVPVAERRCTDIGYGGSVVAASDKLKVISDNSCAVSFTGGADLSTTSLLASAAPLPSSVCSQVLLLSPRGDLIGDNFLWSSVKKPETVFSGRLPDAGGYIIEIYGPANVTFILHDSQTRLVQSRPAAQRLRPILTP